MDKPVSAEQAAVAGTAPEAGDVIVETRNLTKVYRDFWGRQKVRALKTQVISYHAAFVVSVAVL